MRYPNFFDGAGGDMGVDSRDSEFRSYRLLEDQCSLVYFEFMYMNHMGGGGLLPPVDFRKSLQLINFFGSIFVVFKITL